MITNTVALERGLRVAFHTAYSGMLARDYLTAINPIFQRVPSDGNQEKYGWLGDIPAVKEWLGDKAIGGLRDYDYAIKNKDFYAGFAIDRNELDDDQLGGFQARIDGLAEACAQYPYDLIMSLIVNGTTGLAYDGVAFFSNATGDRTIDNLLAGSGATTVAALQTDIAAARSAQMRFTSDSGRVLGLSFDTILCPPELESLMIQAVTTPSVIVTGAGALTNPVSRWIKNVIAMPELTDANDWYGITTSRSLKPFLFQERKMPVPVLDDGQEKKNRKLEFSAEMRGNAGYGFPHMAVKVVNA